MNANELSLQLGFYAETYDGDFGRCLENSSTMLRQQQLKIEALEDQVSDLKLKIFTRKKWGSDIVSDGGLDPRTRYENEHK